MTKRYEGKEQLIAALLAREGIAPSGSTSIKRREPSATPHLSFAQERFWFLNQMEGGAHYNDHLALRLKGNLDKNALERSLNEIVKRHAAYRTTFESVDGVPVQKIADYRKVDLRNFDVSDLSEDTRENEAIRQAEDFLRVPFDLELEPAFRFGLWRLGTENHLFVFCVNQIINDGWSLRVFLGELLTHYRSIVEETPADLPELPIEYADIAVWQREQYANSAMESELDYWKERLAGVLPTLELPSDMPATPGKTFRGARHYISLPGNLLESLRKLARQENATLFMLMLAAFKTLIYRYSGEEDILIGFPVANRDRNETEHLMGVLINPLVLRSDFSDQPTFRELLIRVRETALDGYANQHLPFEKLVETLHPNREAGTSPLFQVLFDYNNVPMPELELPELEVSRVELDAGTAKFDLSFEVTEEANEARGFFEYRTDLFSAEMIERMSGHFLRLLESIVANPDERVSHLPIMSDPELKQVLFDWNSTTAESGDLPSIHAAFEAQVERSPDRTALVCDGKSQTFSELNRYANRIAHFLAASGIVPGSRVGICIERSPEMIGCLIGVLKAGCLYVPLDPNYPLKRLEFMIEDADISILLTQSHLLDRLPESPRSAFDVDTGAEELASQTEENPDIGNEGVGAYIAYTSGSTGRPKGVVGTHRGTLNRFRWMWEKYEFEADEMCCQKTTLSFVDSVWEIFGPLLKGVPSVIISDEITRDPERFIKTLTDHKVTRLVAVPSLIEMLLNRDEDLRDRLGHLNYCVSSGEALSTDLCRRFRKALPNTVLINLYGSSEVSADSTFFEVKAAGIQTESVPIGRPISNTQTYVLDPRLLPVPIGVPGELYIGGSGLSNGYFNRPDLTAERFIRNPFSAESLLFKTGDLARYSSDGNLEFLGRIDDQVKIRGMRVEPGEIETALRNHDIVRDAAVVVREEPKDNRFLVAYVVFKGKEPPVEAEMRKHLGRTLPEYMVPSFFVFVDSLPQTPSGKLNRLALREYPEFRPTVADREITGPGDELEMELASIWKSVLGLETISITDNFFDLGGHSLLAVRLFYAIEKSIGRKLPLATLFKAPSVEQLAAVIRSEQPADAESSLVPIQPKGNKPPFFCIHAAGGNVLFYRDLANRLGSDQPFYGLQARRIDGRQVAHDDLKEMAAFYLDEIQKIQPKGPYYLGGASFGGMVAFEMAHQLEARGEEVGLIAFFDTYAPGYPKYLPGTTLLKKRVLGFSRRIENHWDNIRLLSKGNKRHYVVEKLGKAKHSLWRTKRKYKDIALDEGPGKAVRRIIDRMLGRRRLLPYAAPGVVPGDYRETEGNIRRAFENYEPHTYKGRITLFRASKQELGVIPDHSLGWDMFVSELEIHEVQGHHGSIIVEPHVQFLEKSLRECLVNAQTQVNPTTEKRASRVNELKSNNSSKSAIEIQPDSPLESCERSLTRN